MYIYIYVYKGHGATSPVKGGDSAGFQFGDVHAEVT
jgi:hypothetical protein